MQGVPYALKDITTLPGSLDLPFQAAADHVRLPTRWSRRSSRRRRRAARQARHHEFALGGPSFDLPFPPARNPGTPSIFRAAPLRRGCAVAAGLVRMAWDRTPAARSAPAAYCGTIA